MNDPDLRDPDHRACTPVDPVACQLTEDEIAFAHRLFSHHGPSLLAFFRGLRRMTKVDAGELVQRTFHELLETLARRDDLEIRAPRAFLFKLAVRQLTAERRRDERTPLIDGGDSVLRLPSEAEGDDQEYRASLRTEQRLVLRAMRRLTDRPPGRRTTPPPDGRVSELQLIVYLRFWEGLGLAEIAEIFETTTGAISGRLRRALKRLEAEVARLAGEGRTPDATSTQVLLEWKERLEEEVGS